MFSATETITLDDSDDETKDLVEEWTPSTKDKFKFKTLPPDPAGMAFNFSFQLMNELGRIFCDETRKCASMLWEGKRERDKLAEFQKAGEPIIKLSKVPLSPNGVVNVEKSIRFKRWTEEEDKYIAKANIVRYSITQMNFKDKTRNMSPSTITRIAKYLKIELPKHTARKSTRGDSCPSKKRRIKKNEFVSDFIYKKKQKKKVSLPEPLPVYTRPITRRTTQPDIVSTARKKPGPKSKTDQSPKEMTPVTSPVKKPQQLDSSANLDSSMEGEEIEGYTLCQIDGDIVPVRRSKRTTVGSEKKKAYEEPVLNENERESEENGHHNENNMKEGNIIDDGKEERNVDENVWEEQNVNENVREEQNVNENVREEQDVNSFREEQKENDNPENFQPVVPEKCEEKLPQAHPNKTGKIVPSEEEIEALKLSYAGFIEQVVQQYQIENKTGEIISDKTEPQQIKIISGETNEVMENYEPDVPVKKVKLASKVIIKKDNDESCERVTRSNIKISITNENKDSVEIDVKVPINIENTENHNFSNLSRKIVTRSNAVKQENSSININNIKQEINSKLQTLVGNSKESSDALNELLDSEPPKNPVIDNESTKKPVEVNRIDESSDALGVKIENKIISDDESSESPSKLQQNQTFDTRPRRRIRSMQLSDDETEESQPKEESSNRVPARVRRGSLSDQMQLKKPVRNNFTSDDDSDGSNKINPVKPHQSSNRSRKSEERNESQNKSRDGINFATGGIQKLPRDPRIRARMKSVDGEMKIPFLSPNSAIMETKKIEKRKTSVDVDADLVYRTPLSDLHSDSEATNNYRRVLKKIPKISKPLIEPPKINNVASNKTILTELEKQLEEEQEAMKQLRQQTMMDTGIDAQSIPCPMDISPIQEDDYSPPPGDCRSPSDRMTADSVEPVRPNLFQNRIARVPPQPIPTTSTPTNNQYPHPVRDIHQNPNLKYPLLNDPPLNSQYPKPNTALNPDFHHPQASTSANTFHDKELGTSFSAHIPTSYPVRNVSSGSNYIDQSSILKAMGSVCNDQLANFYQAMESIKGQQSTSKAAFSKQWGKEVVDKSSMSKAAKLIGEIKPWPTDESTTWNRNRHFSDDELEEEEIREPNWNDKDYRPFSKKENEFERQNSWDRKYNSKFFQYKERKKFNYNLSPWEPWNLASASSPRDGSSSDYRSHPKYHGKEFYRRDRENYERDHPRERHWKR